jgi:hypothetical protein
MASLESGGLGTRRMSRRVSSKKHHDLLEQEVLDGRRKEVECSMIAALHSFSRVWHCAVLTHARLMHVNLTMSPFLSRSDFWRQKS